MYNTHVSYVQRMIHCIICHQMSSQLQYSDIAVYIGHSPNIGMDFIPRISCAQNQNIIVSNCSYKSNFNN